ncbi:UDP-Glc:alpha-D-GlcNAc-diphosphoundecaprenol beta-1,3-glucosyltransferase WfgD [Thalassocella blandensis]|nr:UDP-Glc:alpha-D-GlcNAc-diphosphoundecaprenol beta-1,3-glucosyltransferase WfgD [Thalassocella blandensis]
MQKKITPGLVTILMPAFNAEAFIAEAVNSVRQQSLQNWELIIIADDGRDYAHILQQQQMLDERIRFAVTERHQSGPNHARNIGLRMALGEWIAPLDADDVYYPARLETLVAAAGDTGLALDNVNVTGAIASSNNPVISLPGDQAFGFDEFRKCLVPLLFIFHRDIISREWDEDVVRGADTLFNLRALEQAGHACFIASALHEYRVHNQSMCHAAGAEDLFVQAYAHTLDRLKGDGLGFQTQDFRRKVIAQIEEKQTLNQDFLEAVARGFKGNYQNYVQSLGMEFW